MKFDLSMRQYFTALQEKGSCILSGGSWACSCGIGMVRNTNAMDSTWKGRPVVLVFVVVFMASP